MTSSFKPNGVYSAQWIPIDSAGNLNRGRLAALVDFERQHGIDGILALGSTGEFPHFSVDQRKHVLETLVELAAPLPVMANISDIRPQAAIELGRWARELGLPAVALMPPWFYPLSQADALAYFLHVAEAVELPVMLYNFPELTGKRIELETVAAFAERAPLCAVKQSGAEFEYHHALIALGRQMNFVVMSGADTRLPEAFGLGAAGCIGGLVNIVPELMLEIHRSCTEGRAAAAEPAAAKMKEVGTIIDQLSFPLNIAPGLAARGFDPGAPKGVLSPESKSIAVRIRDQLRERFLAWQLPLVTGQAAAHR